MTAGLIYTVGTLFTWLGWIFAARVVYLGLELLLHPTGQDKSQTLRRLGVGALIGAIGLAIGASMPAAIKAQADAGVRLPLVWFVMPYSAWLGVICVAFIIGRLYQAWFALNAIERQERLKAAGLWAIGLAVFFWLYKRDPDSKIEILKGAIPFSSSTVLSIILEIGRASCRERV